MQALNLTKEDLNHDEYILSFVTHLSHGLGAAFKVGFSLAGFSGGCEDLLNFCVVAHIELVAAVVEVEESLGAPKVVQGRDQRQVGD